MARTLCLAFTLLSVASAATTTKEMATEAGTILSTLATSYLGLDDMKNTIKTLKFDSKAVDGETFVKGIATKTTNKLKERMNQVITLPFSLHLPLLPINHFSHFG